LISFYLLGCTQDDHDDTDTVEHLQHTLDHPKPTQKTAPKSQKSKINKIGCDQDDQDDTDTVEHLQHTLDHPKPTQKTAPKSQKSKINPTGWSEKTLTQLQTLEKSTLQKIEMLFQDTDSSFSIYEVPEHTKQIIAEIEPQVRQIVKTDIQQQNDSQKELSVQRTLLEIEKNAYFYSTTKLNTYLQRTSGRLDEALRTLARKSKESNTAIKNTYMEPVFHESDSYKRYQKNITEVAQQKIKSKYTRAELGLLKKEELIPPEEDLYRLLSPDGEFFDKLRDVYGKLRNANPYHEQGILARECGLQRVILGDQEFLKGNKEKAQEIYNHTQFLMKIVLGELPLGKERDIYQTCTGKDLLTGAFLNHQQL